MACHSSSDFCTDPGGGVDDDIAATLGSLRPAPPRDAGAAAWPRHGRAAHERGADRGRAAEGEGAMRREESGRAARGAKAATAGQEHEWHGDAILSLSRRWTPMLLLAAVKCDVSRSLPDKALDSALGLRWMMVESRRPATIPSNLFFLVFLEVLCLISFNMKFGGKLN